VLDPLHDQLGDPVATTQVQLVAWIVVDEADADLAAVPGVDGAGRVDHRQPGAGRQPGARVHERRVPVGQGDRDPGPHQGPFARPELDVLGRRQVRARVARMGVRRQRDAGVKALDQHVRLGLRQRRTPYWWHAR
jgi:hypothetical protein